MIKIDPALRNDDWLRTRTWDLWVGDLDDMRLVTSLSDLFSLLNVPDASVKEQQQAILQFLHLPSSEAMPPSLKEEVATFLHPPSPAAQNGSKAFHLIGLHPQKSHSGQGGSTDTGRPPLEDKASARVSELISHTRFSGDLPAADRAKAESSLRSAASYIYEHKADTALNPLHSIKSIRVMSSVGEAAETSGRQVRIAARVLDGRLHPVETASILVHEAAHANFHDSGSEKKATDSTIWWAAERLRTERDPAYEQKLDEVIYYQTKHAERLAGHGIR